MGLSSHEGLEPEPMPIEVKIILVTDWPLYAALLDHLPQDIQTFFRVRAEFSSETERTAATEQGYAAFLETCREREGLLEFDKTAVARLVEHGSRLAEDKYKLTLDMGAIKAIAVEANYYAKAANAPRIFGAHIEQAIQKQEERVSSSRRSVHEFIQEGLQLLQISGEEVGRGNALIVHSTEIPFGVPITMTANLAASLKDTVFSIDRSVRLTGKTFNKGVDTAASFIEAQYGGLKRIPYRITLSKEQNYGFIEGDSSSALETLLALSSLGKIPLRQDIAVTGSLNQHGEIQPIGGVNEKIEGFFDVCKELGELRGQGVLIPELNVRHLVLRQDVVQACAEGNFNIWSMRTIAEGMQLLSGLRDFDVSIHVRQTIDMATSRQAKKVRIK